MTDKTIKVLSIEDNPGDAQLIQALLAEARTLAWDLPRFELEWVRTLADGLARLDAGGIDVVLSDLDLPDSRAGDTFAAVYAHAPQVPIVVLTGREDEELARHTVRAGAEDYLFKREMSGPLLAHALIYAIERQQAKGALQEAHDELEGRVQRRTEALRESEQRYRQLVELSPDLIAVHSQGRILYINEAGARLLGASGPEQIIGKRLYQFVNSERKVVAQRRVERLLAKGAKSPVYEQTVRRLDGTKVTVEVVGTPCVYQGQEAVQIIAHDISHRKQTEKALRQSNEERRALLDLAPVAIVITDQAGNVVEANRASEELLGITTEERAQQSYGGPRWQVVRPDGTPMPPEEYAGARALREQRVVRNVEMGIVTSGNGTVWVSASAMPIPLEGYGVAITYADVTERRRIEEALRESEEKYRLLVENLNEGIWYIDQDARTTFVNPRMAEMLGYTVKEMLGRHLFDFMDDRGVEIAKRQLARREQGIEEQHDFEFVRQDGTRIYTSMETTPITDGEHYIGALAGVQDVTERKKMKDRLEQAQKELERIFNLTPDMICVAHVDGYFERLNVAWTRVLGYSLEELKARPFLDFIHPDDREATLAEVEKQVEGQPTLYFENRYRSKDGDWKWLAWQATPADEAGFLYAAARDVTKRKRIETELFQVHQQLAGIMDHSPNIVTLMDRRGHYLMINEAGARALGQEATDIVGQSFADVLPQDAADTFLERLNRVFETGLPLKVEDRLPTPAGERVHTTTLFPLFDPRDAVYAVGGIAMDITERVQAEENSRRQKAFLKTLLETVPTPIFYKDIGGWYTGCNRAFEEFVGRSREEIIGKSVYDLASQEIADKYAEKDRELFRRPGQQRYEWKVKGSDGQIRDVIFDKASILGIRGQPVGLVGAITDITERKKAEEEIKRHAAELERSNRELEQFAHTVSHDLKAPLRTVRSYLELVQRRCQGQLDAETNAFIDYAIGGAARLQEMIRALLDLTRVHTRGREMSPVDCQALLERTLAMYETDIEETGATVTHDPLPTVPADEAQLAQVFQNLVGNALKG